MDTGGGERKKFFYNKSLCGAAAFASAWLRMPFQRRGGASFVARWDWWNSPTAVGGECARESLRHTGPLYICPDGRVTDGQSAPTGGE